MAIQSRRGNIANFDANKMLPGEFACALDTGELFYCVSPGNVKRCATKEELQQILTSTPEAYTALQELIANLQNQTVLTGILNDISNLKSTKLAITGDSKTNTTTFTEAGTLANINSAETHATLFGKIKKFFSFVGTTTLTTTAQTISAATNEILAANRSGWSAILETDKLTYKSASAPTFVCNTLNTSNAAKDMRPYLSAGMKLKITQDAVVKYFFITAIDATSITLYGGTDYVLTNTAITNVCYSMIKAPYGFPLEQSKWSITITSNTPQAVVSPSNSYKQVGNLGINIPIGVWNVSMFVTMEVAVTNAIEKGFWCSLSSSLTDATNPELVSFFDWYVDPSFNAPNFITSVEKVSELKLTQATTFYVIAKAVASIVAQMRARGELSVTTINATCAYL